MKLKSRGKDDPSISIGVQSVVISLKFIARLAYTGKEKINHFRDVNVS